MPWKNGGGVTREYVREPAGDAPLEWRLSVAEVASDGPFSSFPGLHRILVLLSGSGMRLHGPLHDATLRSPLEALEFPGEADIDASLIDGATTDLNLMWRPEHWHVDWAVRRGALHTAGTPDGVDDVQVIFVAAGRLRLGKQALDVGDAAWWIGARAGVGAVVDGGAAVHFTLRRPEH